MRTIRSLLVLGILATSGPALCQVGQNWSAARSVLPPGFGASEARVVILSDGSIHISFRGSDSDDPQVGGIYYTRSNDQGYSWAAPKPAVTVSGILSITHELLADGDTLLLFMAINQLARYEVKQFRSANRGQTWDETETLYSDADPVHGLVGWKQDGRMYMMILSERLRPGGESEFSFWLSRGRASGAYWDPPTKVSNFFARAASPIRLVPNGRWPWILWKQNNADFHVLEAVAEDGTRWRDRTVAIPPSGPVSILSDRGVSYQVVTTAARQLLFNRTDDLAPTSSFLSTIPRDIDKPNLKLAWEGKDNYTLPASLRYELILDEGAPVMISSATTHEFTELKNGSHMLQMVAIDEARNRQSPATIRRFTVRVLPTAKFLSPRNGDLLNRGDLTASWEGTHNCRPEDPLLYSLKVDDGEWSEFSPEPSANIQGLADGDHALFLRAKDALDNISALEASVRFEVDSTPPTCVAEELPRDWERIAQEVDFDTDPVYEVRFGVRGTDNRTSADELQYRYRLDQNPPSEWTPIVQQTVLTGLSDGFHQISFEARDEAQNVQSEPASLRFDFNTPPNTRVLADDSGQVLIYRFAGKDSNSRTLDIMFRWRIDQGDWSDWTSEASLQATDLLAKADHGEHVLYVQSRDAAGNVDPTPAELVVDIDKRPPPPPASVSIVSQDDGGEITLSWDPSPEANVSYRVYRSTTENLNKAEAFTVEMDTTRPRSSDRPRRGETSMTLYYFVTSVDRSGNESEETPAKPEIVLGMKEINEKKFELYRTDVDKQIRSSQWDQVLQMADNVPMELITPPERAPYQTFWRNLASAKKALAESPTRPEALAASRNDLDAFIQVNPAFPQVKEAQDAFEEVKSALLWHRLKFFGMIGAALIVALFVLSMIYRWVQNRRIPEMPMIHAGTGTEGVTPTKEALKDPTVLRRWTEVQAEPTSAENWSRLAFAFHNIGEVENAIQSLYKAMEIEPNNTRFHFQMGHFQKEAGRTKDAIRHFERYLQLNPESKKSAEEVRELLGKLKAEEEKRG